VKTRLTALGGNMLSSEILKKAQRAIVEHGWIKSKLGTEETGFCMLGALKYAREDKNMMYTCNSKEYVLLESILQTEYSDYCGVTDYNDSIALTKTEVIEVFNRAIQLAKCKERA
jgi:hypothetical protein